ncbi:hypothetical protein IM792_11955 [Mucilaginibacter sp. JRF]|uniref:hypothetical protein n=1 Tax=Mucilaginibacter sp. JRF TaxID=2780088 RepID=UPI0018800C7F|nr:hypothetical protein [Mucilaginibacter sp. JRF]MBE9585165.1 hypothetical protein [Mucilaginibacter sp. JRF]
MKKSITLILIVLFMGCKTEKIDPNKIIYDLFISNRTPPANGSSIVDIAVQLDPTADDDKREVVFHTSAGTFTGNKDTLFTRKAEYIDGKLTANVKLSIPMSPTKIYLTVKPASTSRFNSFNLKDSLEAILVAPDKIKLSPSALAVSTGFSGEVLLTATLSRNGDNVSRGTKVLFEDFLTNGQPANGRYRMVKASSDASSVATCYYSPNYLTPGTDILIKCTYIDNVSIKDSCFINVVPKN